VFDKPTNRLYDGSGNVVDPATGTHAGLFNVRDTISYEPNDVAVDAPGGRAFFLNIQAFNQPVDLQAFDLSTFAYKNALTVSGLNGSHVVRWGAAGLAVGGGSKIFLVEGSFVASAGTSTAVGGYASASSAITSVTPSSAYAGDGSTSVVLTGTDFTGAAVATWNNRTLPITVQSATQATVTFSSSLLATAVASSITLTNGPGTVVSNSVPGSQHADHRAPCLRSGHGI
jgi:hypothetical protein